METTKVFSSQTIKEEPSSPIALWETTKDRNSPSYKVVSEKEVKANAVESPSQTDATCFGEDIKTEELDIPSNNGEDEKKYNEWLEPASLALKKETICSEWPEREDDKITVKLVVPHIIPHEDINNLVFYENSKLTGNKELPYKNHGINKLLSNKLYAKSYVFLGNRIDHVRKNINNNQQTTTSGFHDLCTQIDTAESKQGGSSIASKTTPLEFSKVNELLLELKAKSSGQHSERVEYESLDKPEKFLSHRKGRASLFPVSVKTFIAEQQHNVDKNLELFSEISNRRQKRNIKTTNKSENCKNYPKNLDKIGRPIFDNCVSSNEQFKGKLEFSCMTNFTSKYSLKLPLRPHISEKRLLCNYCMKFFLCKAALIRHLRTHSGERPYSCSLCMKSFSYKSAMIRHFRTHSGERPYSCSQCMKSFSYKPAMIRHFRTHSGERPYSCSQCMKSFLFKSVLIGHLRTHSGEKPYTCSHCMKSFSDLSNLKRHLRTHTDKRPYSCQHCKKSFSCHSHLRMHLRTHSGENPFSCNHCNKSFLYKSVLIGHLRTHSGEKPYSCSHCMKSFSDKSALIQHLRTHSGNKPFSCNHCNKAFLYKSVLIGHLRTHSGEKPYSCSHCMKSFSDLSNLKRHLRTHTFKKPYSCQHCKKSFSRHSYLRMHLRTHSGEKPYSCIQCMKSFSQQSKLKQHMTTHTGKQPYSCDHCFKSFSQEITLLRHLNTHTGE